MDSITLVKLNKIDTVNKQFEYECDVYGSKRNLLFPWGIVGHTFPKRFPLGSKLSVSYFGDNPNIVDWLGVIND